MKIYTLNREQILPHPLEDVFHFFESPVNLERITPASVGFTILTPRPIKMHAGAVLDYTIGVLGFPVRWTTLITDYEPPHRFADIALKGPYSFWHHTHTFETTAESTRMTDRVEYALPFGWLGRLAHTLWVKRQLKAIFDYRSRVIGELLASQAAADGKQSNGSRQPVRGPS